MPLRTVGATACMIAVALLGVVNIPARGTSHSTFTTLTKPIHSFSDNGVLVTVRAEKSSIDLRCGNGLGWNDRQRTAICGYIENPLLVTPQSVLLHGDSLQMIGTDAVANKAEMVDFVPFGNSADHILICESMRRGLSPSVAVLNRECTVAVRPRTADPLPASSFTLSYPTPETPLFSEVIHRGIIPQYKENRCE
jgi:hypothetical protein